MRRASTALACSKIYVVGDETVANLRTLFDLYFKPTLANPIDLGGQSRQAPQTERRFPGGDEDTHPSKRYKLDISRKTQRKATGSCSNMMFAYRWFVSSQNGSLGQIPQQNKLCIASPVYSLIPERLSVLAYLYIAMIMFSMRLTCFLMSTIAELSQF